MNTASLPYSFRARSGTMPMLPRATRGARLALMARSGPAMKVEPKLFRLPLRASIFSALPATVPA